MDRVDVAIQEIERFYRELTGRDLPPTGETVLPPEIDPVARVADRLEVLLRALPARARHPRRTWNPATSVVEAESGFVVEVDLPGISHEEVEVLVQGNRLEIRGRRDLVTEGRPQASDRPYGEFRRSLLFPVALDEKGLESEIRDGVLEVRVPRAQRPDRPASIQ